MARYETQEEKSNGMIDVPQPGGLVNTYYPTTTGGKPDVFSVELPAFTDEKDRLEEDVSIRLEAYNDMNKATRDFDLAKAGFVGEAKGDPFLYDIANQDFIIRQTKINAWEQHLQNSFNEIRKNEKLNDEEKMRMKSEIVVKMPDPIYIPKIQKPKEDKSPFEVAAGGGLQLKTGTLGQVATAPSEIGYSYDEATGDYIYSDPKTGKIVKSKQKPGPNLSWTPAGGGKPIGGKAMKETAPARMYASDGKRRIYSEDGGKSWFDEKTNQPIQ